MCYRRIRENKKDGPTPKIIEGRDCNGLYLSAFNNPMPTGFATIWEQKHDTCTSIPVNGDETTFAELKLQIARNMRSNFDKQQTGQHFDEIIFVCFLLWEIQKNANRKLSLQHAWNGGQKVFHVNGSILPVDGWIPETGTIIQFHGCYYHGHNCYLTKSCNPSELVKRADDTDRVAKLLKTTGNRRL